MSSTFDTTASRFFRPTDVAALRRNQRRIHAQRLLVVLRGAVVLAIVAGIGFWSWQRTQSDARFAVRAIDVVGATHTPRAAIDLVTRRYVGMNLFKIDIARVQHDLGGLPWIRRIDIEKQLPDSLRIKITERTPVALVRAGDRLLYADDEGRGFAELTTSVGDDDLPLITDATGGELARAVSLLRDLRASDPQIYSRISEVRPVAPHGFALFDRQLGAFVYVDRENVSEKWRTLYAILEAEQSPAIEYADLRFTGRLIVKPRAVASARHTTPLPRTDT